MNRIHAATAAVATAATLTLTGCGEPGWQGEAPITELELMQAEREGGQLEYDSLEVTVLTRNGERSVNVEHCPDDVVRLGQEVSVDYIVDKCGEIGWSEDD